MTIKQKPNLMLADLLKSNAVQVAILNKQGYLFSHDLTVAPADTSLQGFYFLVDSDHTTVARFYVGRQRTKSGLECVTKHIRRRRSKVCEKLMDSNAQYDVYYIPTERMKPLTTAVNKGKISTMLTRGHNDRFQNLEEMNRMLNDNFKFKFQSY